MLGPAVVPEVDERRRERGGLGLVLVGWRGRAAAAGRIAAGVLQRLVLSDNCTVDGKRVRLLAVADDVLADRRRNAADLVELLLCAREGERARRPTAAVHDGSWWKVQCSRSSATLVFVAIRFLGPRNHTW
ncbi:MAG TPA: hypothetical protein VKB13_08735 [Gaiellaceae bacterium]|nr:hypothetical protein [Gaiellaceae bacterium]